MSRTAAGLLTFALVFAGETTRGQERAFPALLIRRDAPAEVEPDADDARLLNTLKRMAEKDAELRRVHQLIDQLGDNAFEKREDASQRLVVLGAAALPALRKARESNDPEVVRRAAACIQQIERQPKQPTEREVVRRLLDRQPKGLVAALLDFLPTAHEHAAEEEIYFGLEKLSQRGTGLDPALKQALRDEAASRRALAALLVTKFGGEKDKAAAAKLLEDENPDVRLRTAQGLLAANDKRGIPPLIKLVGNAPRDLAWQAEELLRYAAGGKAPAFVLGKGSKEEARRCHEAWLIWWKANEVNVDLLAAQRTNRRPGLVLAIEERSERWLPASQRYAGPEKVRPWEGKVWLCGFDGQPRCEPFTLDQLIATLGRDAISDNAFGGSRLQELGLLPRTRYIFGGNERRPNQWQAVCRLRSGNRLIAEEASRPDGVNRIAEVDPAGRTVWEALFGSPAGGILVFPLVRVGFPTPTGHNADLDMLDRRLRGADHRDPLVRRFAWEFLKESPPDKVFVQRAKMALGDTDQLVRCYAAEVMKKSGAGAADAIPELIRLLDEPGRAPRCDAAEALRQCGSKAVPALLKALEPGTGTKASLRRSTAIGVLARLVSCEDPQLHGALKAGFSDTDRKVRLALVLQLGNERGKAKRYVPDVLASMTDTDPEVAAAARRTLGEIGEAAAPDALPPLLEMLQNRELRGDAIEILAKVGRKSPKVLPAILACLRDDDFNTCAMVASVLGDFGGDDAKTVVPVLQRLMWDERLDRSGCEKAIQVRAISSLARLGAQSREAVPGLVKLGQGSDTDWLTAVHALESIDPVAARKVREAGEAKRRPPLVAGQMTALPVPTNMQEA